MNNSKYQLLAISYRLGLGENMRQRQHKKNIKNKLGIILKKGSRLVKVYFKKDHVDCTEELHNVLCIDNLRGKHTCTLAFPDGLDGIKSFHDGNDLQQRLR